MSLHSCRVEVYRKLSDNTYSSTINNSAVPTNFSLNWSLEQKADAFNIMFPLLDVNDFDKYPINDKIKVYGIIDGSETLLVDGIIQKAKTTTKAGTETIILNCLNRMEKMFNALVATTGETITHTAKYWLQSVILAQVNDLNENLTIGWAAENDDYPSTELVPFTRGYTPALQLLEELSQPEYNGGVSYIYYLNNDNELVWKPRDPSSLVQKDIILGTNNFEQNIEKALWEIVNYIILNCGKNLYGNFSILQLGYDQTSIAEYGWKMKVVLALDIADTLKKREFALQSDNGVNQQDSLFPTTYPYTTSWGETVTDDASYNKAFVARARLEGTARISELLKYGTSPTYRIKSTINPSFDYVLGQNYRIQNRLIGWDSSDEVILRLKEIDYEFNKNGWTVGLSLEEDEEEVGPY